MILCVRRFDDASKVHAHARATGTRPAVTEAALNRLSASCTYVNVDDPEGVANVELEVLPPAETSRRFANAPDGVAQSIDTIRFCAS